MAKRDDSKGYRNGEYSEDTPYLGVHSAVLATLGSVHALFVRSPGDAIEFRIKHRGEHDWLGIAKRVGSDGKPEVLFSSGGDFIEALLGLDRGISVGAWKEDKPWSPSE